MLCCRCRLQVLHKNVYIRTCTRRCVRASVCALLHLSPHCVLREHVVVVATHVCVFCLCVQTCLCVFKGVQSYLYIYVQVHSYIYACMRCACGHLSGCMQCATVLQETVMVQPCEYNHTMLQLQQQLGLGSRCNRLMYFNSFTICFVAVCVVMSCDNSGHAYNVTL